MIRALLEPNSLSVIQLKASPSKARSRWIQKRKATATAIAPPRTIQANCCSRRGESSTVAADYRPLQRPSDGLGPAPQQPARGVGGYLGWLRQAPKALHVLDETPEAGSLAF